MRSGKYALIWADAAKGFRHTILLLINYYFTHHKIQYETDVHPRGDIPQGSLPSLMVFSFLPNNVHFITKNAISCLFLKNVSPSKRVICFILNNSHLSMVEGIAVYALHKSRVLIIPCKADDFCLFIRLPDEIYKKAPDMVI